MMENYFYKTPLYPVAVLGLLLASLYQPIAQANTCNGWRAADGLGQTFCGESPGTVIEQACDSRASGSPSSIWGQIEHFSSPSSAQCGFYYQADDSPAGGMLRGAGKTTEVYPDDEEECVEKGGTNPINLKNGYKHQYETDLTAPVGSALNITRFYSSKPELAQWSFPFSKASQRLDIRPVYMAPVCTAEPGQSCSYDFTHFEIFIDAYRSNGTVARFNTTNNVHLKNVSIGIKDYYDTLTYSITNPSRDISLSFNSGLDRWELENNKTQEVEFYTSGGTFIGAEDAQHYRYDITLDINDNIDRIDDTRGNWLDYTLDDDIQSVTYGQPIFIESSWGEVAHYLYDSLGRLTHAGIGTDKNNLATFVYRNYLYEDSNFPEGLTGVIDENGDRSSTWTYSNGLATSSSHGDLGTLSYDDLVTALANSSPSLNSIADLRAVSYGANQVTVTNPLGKDTTYHWQAGRMNGQVDDRLKLTSSIEGVATPSCAGANQNFQYDTQGYVKQKTSWAGKITEYVNNGRGLPTLTTIRGSSTADYKYITTTWHPTARLKLDETISQGFNNTQDLVKTEYQYLPNLRTDTVTITDLTTHTSPYSSYGNTRIWDYSYTYWDVEETQLKTLVIDGPRTDVADITTHEYNLQGWLVKTTNALGHTTEILEHSPHGHPAKIIDANGVETRMTYHFRGWLETITVENGNNDAVTTMAYDNVGQLTTITQANGSSLHYDYDSAHRLIKITDGDGATIEYTLDNAGNRIGEVIKDSGGTLLKTQTRTFDELSRLRQTLGANNQTVNYNYDLNNNVNAVTDGKSQTTHSAYDAVDRVIEQTDPDNFKVKYIYDALDRITKVTDQENQSTYYTYDGLGNLMKLGSWDTGITTYSYDAAGNRLSQTDGGGVVTQYSYDALNRLIATSYPASPTENISYSYDDTTGNNKGIGRLTSITGPTGVTSYQYDFLGNVINTTNTLGGISYSTAYSYNPAGQITSITYPTGRLVHYGYDNQGRVNNITTQANAGAPLETVVSGASYLPFGGITAYNYGNAINQQFDYDQDYRLSLNRAMGLANPLDLSYSYDANNNIAAITDQNNASNNQNFDYDPINRLEQAIGPYGQLDYQYDGVGNRLQQSQTLNGNVTTDSYTYSPTSHQLNRVSTSEGGINSHRYLIPNDRGSRELEIAPDGSINRYHYNDAGRFIALEKDGTVLADYQHNALGQRVIKIAQGSPVITDHYHYDTAGRLIAVTDAAGINKREMIYLGNKVAGILLNDSYATEWQSFSPPTISTPPPTNVANFNNYTISPFSVNQDIEGTATVSDNGGNTGATLTLAGNRWKSINLSYTITPQTILAFDFSSSQQGEIHGIGFDNDNAHSAEYIFQLYGSQNWGIQAYKNYPGDGSTQRYLIPIGQYYTGQFDYLVFTMDHDIQNPNGESVFSNIEVYEP